uniref:beta-N-acetylhexosaminidase n=1 Tax=Timema douglasi TaxID=61478 RepID=A0A7R8VAC8_TIMDO|nr:unnamed protein product [Timema douglasi]
MGAKTSVNTGEWRGGQGNTPITPPLRTTYLAPSAENPSIIIPDGISSWDRVYRNHVHLPALYSVNKNLCSVFNTYPLWSPYGLRLVVRDAGTVKQATNALSSNYSSPTASLVLTDNSQLTSDSQHLAIGGESSVRTRVRVFFLTRLERRGPQLVSGIRALVQFSSLSVYLACGYEARTFHMKEKKSNDLTLLEAAMATNKHHIRLALCFLILAMECRSEEIRAEGKVSDFCAGAPGFNPRSRHRFILLPNPSFTSDKTSCECGYHYTLAWYWTWSCQSGRCVKSDSPSTKPTPGINKLSQEACRLTCGQYGALWPHPTGDFSLGADVVPFHPSRVTLDLLQVGSSLYHSLVSGSSRAPRRLITGAWERFLENLQAECGGNCSVVPDTTVNVQLDTSSSDLKLNWDTDESYSLSLTTRGSQVTVQIQATTVFGARHGLETLSQLVAGFTRRGSSRRGGSGGLLKRRGLLLLSEANITDRPTWAHRGLLLDTARNYLPLDDIKRTVDAMASSKLNVLHWHATDTQSFPLDFPRVPELASFGAYSSREVYTPSDVTELLEYSLTRGVRVLLELDAPSHAGNGWQWGPSTGLGDLAVCVNQQPWRSYCIQPPCGQLNPANPGVYRVLQDLYKDVLELWPEGEALHMGGDEVFFPCWNSSTQVVEWMQSRGLGRTQADFLQVWGEYQETALNILDKSAGHSNTPVILWSSQLTQPGVIENYLSKDRYVIETWVESTDDLPHSLLSKGYRVIMATKDAWYLDHGFWGRTVYHNWRAVYDNTLPRGVFGILGGEAAMWAELVDGRSLDARVWPRAAALAERLWSDPYSGSSEAELRFYQHRERLVRQGIGAEAVAPKWCVQNEGECQAN